MYCLIEFTGIALFESRQLKKYRQKTNSKEIDKILSIREKFTLEAFY
jgi:hypothetical protein